MGVRLSTLLLPWRQGTGLYRSTDACTHTCTPSHIRESTPKAETEDTGGGSGQSDISSWAPATEWKCHIIRPDTSIKVKKSFLTVDSKRITTSLPSVSVSLCIRHFFLFFKKLYLAPTPSTITTHTHYPQMCKWAYTFTIYSSDFLTNETWQVGLLCFFSILPVYSGDGVHLRNIQNPFHNPNRVTSTSVKTLLSGEL